MKLEHEFTVPVPVEEAWRVLLDVERIAPCMPGATLLSVDGRDFTGSVKVKVGPIMMTYQGNATFAELDEVGRRVVIQASGKDTRGGGTAAATVTALLTDGGPRTTVQVETDLNVTGRPAQFGRGVMAEVGAKLIGQFATCLADELGAGGSDAAAESAEAPPAPESMSDLAAPGEPVDAGAVEAAEAPVTKAAAKKTAAKKSTSATKTTSAATSASTTAKKTTAKKTAAKKTTSAAKSEAGATTSGGADAAAAKLAGPPVSAPAAPRAPRPPAEPIDLLDVAGGSVAKRVAPVAAALLLLVLLLRRRRNR